MSFRVLVVEGAEPFCIRYGSTVEEAFSMIHQSFPHIFGIFRVVTSGTEEDLTLDAKFPDNGDDKHVIFIAEKQTAANQQG